MWGIFDTELEAQEFQEDMNGRYDYPNGLAANYAEIRTPHDPGVAGTKWAVPYEVLFEGDFGLFVPPTVNVAELPAGWIDDSMDRLYPP